MWSVDQSNQKISGFDRWQLISKKQPENLEVQCGQKYALLKIIKVPAILSCSKRIQQRPEDCQRVCIGSLVASLLGWTNK